MNYSQLMNRNDTKPDEWQTSQRFVNVGLRPLKIPLFLYQIRQNLKLKQKQINCSSLKMERYVTWINMGKRCVEKLMMNSNEDDTPTFVQPTLWVFFFFFHTQKGSRKYQNFSQTTSATISHYPASPPMSREIFLWPVKLHLLAATLQCESLRRWPFHWHSTEQWTTPSVYTKLDLN